MLLIRKDSPEILSWHSFLTIPGKRMPSSVIHHIIYNEGSQRLRVFFISGITYDYINFPKELYDRLRQAFSKGKFLNEHIKGKYSFEKVKEN
jgi:KTSC domain